MDFWQSALALFKRAAMTVLQETLACDFIIGFHGKYCAMREYEFKSGKKPKTRKQDAGMQWRRRWVAVCRQLHVCHQRWACPCGYPAHVSLAQMVTAPCYPPHTLQRPAHPNSCFLQPHHPKPDPAAPSPAELRHSPEYKSLEGTRVIFSSKSSVLIFITSTVLLEWVGSVLLHGWEDILMAVSLEQDSSACLQRGFQETESSPRKWHALMCHQPCSCHTAFILVEARRSPSPGLSVSAATCQPQRASHNRYFQSLVLGLQECLGLSQIPLSYDKLNPSHHKPPASIGARHMPCTFPSSK